MREFFDLCVIYGSYALFGGVMRECWCLWSFGGVYAFLVEFMRLLEGRRVSSIILRRWVALNGFDKLGFGFWELST